VDKDQDTPAAVVLEEPHTQMASSAPLPYVSANPVTAARRRLAGLRNWPLGMRVGAVILLVHIAIALTGPYWMPYRYNQIATGPSFSGPSAAHIFGTDQLGRDVFSRVVYGSRMDFGVALLGTALGVIAGAAIGLLAAYVRGWFDEIVMRVFEMIISIPLLILALVIIAAAGPETSSSPLFLATLIGLVNLPQVARTMRAAATEIVTRDFVAIARARGESAWSIMWRELLPNTTGTLLVEMAVRCGAGIIIIGSLGFLGFGAKPPIPEWGLMISENRSMLVAAPHTVLAPSLAVATLVIGLNLLGDGLARVLGHSTRRAGERR
jgi:peptide/nickel transport system permease protein